MPAYRKPSVPLSVKDIHSAAYQQMDGWDPDYLIVNDRKVYRTLLIGMILSRKEEDDKIEFIFDDGTGSIPVLFYESKPGVKEGDIVLLIGRPRDLAGRVIIGEIIRPVSATWKPYWEKRKELVLTWQPKQEVIQAQQEDVEEVPVEEETPLEEKKSETEKSDTERVYELIKQLDDGLGAPVERIIEEAAKQGIMNAEKAIRFMLEVGDIFEIRAGRLKVL